MIRHRIESEATNQNGKDYYKRRINFLRFIKVLSAVAVLQAVAAWPAPDRSGFCKRL